MRRRLRNIALFLAGGVVATVMLAWVSAFFIDLSASAGSTMRNGAAWDGHVQWTVRVNSFLGSERVYSKRERGRAWSVDQATGPPDTGVSGDIQTAWASLTPDGQREWLELDYDAAVKPVEVYAYESFNPGAIDKVTLYDAAGHEYVAWDASTSTAQSAQSQVPRSLRSGVPIRVYSIPRDAPVTRRIRLDLNSPAVSGWNEIDAVAMKDAAGKFYWARDARASSTYAGNVPISDQASAMVPRWSGLAEPSGDFAPGSVRVEEKIVEGRGWPMPALRADVTSASGPAIPLGPIWPGFAIDALLLAAVAWGMKFLLTRPWRFLIEASRARKGCCLRCGYDLQFDLAHGCPECGWRREAPAVAAPATPAAVAAPTPARGAIRASTDSRQRV